MQSNRNLSTLHNTRLKRRKTMKKIYVFFGVVLFSIFSPVSFSDYTIGPVSVKQIEISKNGYALIYPNIVINDIEGCYNGDSRNSLMLSDDHASFSLLYQLFLRSYRTNSPVIFTMAGDCSAFGRTISHAELIKR